MHDNIAERVEGDGEVLNSKLRLERLVLMEERKGPKGARKGSLCSGAVCSVRVGIVGQAYGFHVQVMTNAANVNDDEWILCTPGIPIYGSLSCLWKTSKVLNDLQDNS